MLYLENNGNASREPIIFMLSCAMIREENPSNDGLSSSRRSSIIQ